MADLFPAVADRPSGEPGIRAAWLMTGEEIVLAFALLFDPGEDEGAAYMAAFEHGVLRPSPTVYRDRAAIRAAIRARLRPDERRAIDAAGWTLESMQAALQKRAERAAGKPKRGGRHGRR